MPWDPDRYHQFQSERAAPFFDLLALVAVRPGLRAVDLGCGTGELTRQLADALPESDVVGIDNSPSMLERAAPHARPGLRFEMGDIGAFAAGAEQGWDLIFSNAALHWVEDHGGLIPRLLSLLAPGGQLVVQVPSNHGHPSQTVIPELAGEEPYRSMLGGWRRVSPVLPIRRYAELLFEHGATEIVVFEKVYPHVMEDADAVADWVSGTSLVPYFERLGPELRDEFMADYRGRLRALWPGSPVFYPFQRTLFAARVGAAGGGDRAQRDGRHGVLLRHYEEGGGALGPRLAHRPKSEFTSSCRPTPRCSATSLKMPFSVPSFRGSCLGMVT